MSGITLAYGGFVTAYPKFLTTTDETTIATGRKQSRELIGIHLANRDASNAVLATVTITFASSSDVFHLFSSHSVAAGGYLQRTGLDIPFRDGDTIKVTASAANDLDVLAIVREDTPVLTR